jgi:hypothetical protein
VTNTVFLSGSRDISRLNEQIRQRLGNIVQKGYRVVVGDANGADKAFQRILAEINYGHVEVFCSGNTCRNNIGGWPARNVRVDAKLKGRDFYTQKDKAMAAEADYGFVVWNGESAGSISNVVELLKRAKPVLLYLATVKRFFALKSAKDLRHLLDQCPSFDKQIVVDEIDSDKQLQKAETQGALSF